MFLPHLSTPNPGRLIAALVMGLDELPPKVHFEFFRSRLIKLDVPLGVSLRARLLFIRTAYMIGAKASLMR